MASGLKTKALSLLLRSIIKHTYVKRASEEISGFLGLPKIDFKVKEGRQRRIDGGFFCPLTNMQMRNFRTLENLDDYVWSTKVKFDRTIDVTLNEDNQEWLKNIWDLGNEDALADFFKNALLSLNKTLALDNRGYITVYVKEDTSPRTLFEFKYKED